MSEPKKKIDISDLKDTFLECPVCVEYFNQTDRCPRLLHSCLHAFCTQCLRQLLRKEGQNRITCPLCRQIQMVTDVRSLRMDPVRHQLLEYVQLTHKQNVSCKGCPDDNRAKSRCMECGENLCKDCETAHRRHRSSRTHRIIPLEEVGKECPETLKIRHVCPTHADHVVECFCENCEVLCCFLCALIDHSGHAVKKLEDAAKLKIEEIELALRDVETDYEKLTTAKSDFEEYVCDIQSDKEKLLSDINETFTTAEQLLDERKFLLLEKVKKSSRKLEVDAKKNARLCGDALTEIKSTQTYFSNAKSKADEVIFLQAYPSLKKNLTILTNNPRDGIEICTEKVAFDATLEEKVHKYINRFGAVKIIPTNEGYDEAGSNFFGGKTEMDSEAESISATLSNDVIGRQYKRYGAPLTFERYYPRVRSREKRFSDLD